MSYLSTEKAEIFSIPGNKDEHWVRFVYRDTEKNRCTIFFSVSNRDQANVWVDALNAGLTRNSEKTFTTQVTNND